MVVYAGSARGHFARTAVIVVFASKTLGFLQQKRIE